MKSLRMQLEETRKHTGLPWEIIERDYLLSWILAGISQTNSLSNSLIFKGGTALKKCYFGNYRFSEDLDFTALSNAPVKDDLEQALIESCDHSVKLLHDIAPVAITCERYTERDPHPTAQEAFIIRAQFPWQKKFHTRIMVEITIDEKIYYPVQTQNIIHNYEEPFMFAVSVYALEEIMAEKLRALLQQEVQLQKRGWIRSRARDYYDLWRILTTFNSSLNLKGFRELLLKKCEAKNITFSKGSDFFKADTLAYIEETWVQWLAPLVPSLPTYQDVISELKSQIEFLMP